jgi:hypothetical protein
MVHAALQREECRPYKEKSSIVKAKYIIDQTQKLAYFSSERCYAYPHKELNSLHLKHLGMVLLLSLLLPRGQCNSG